MGALPCTGGGPCHRGRTRGGGSRRSSEGRPGRVSRPAHGDRIRRGTPGRSAVVVSPDGAGVYVAVTIPGRRGAGGALDTATGRFVRLVRSDCASSADLRGWHGAVHHRPRLLHGAHREASRLHRPACRDCAVRHRGRTDVAPETPLRRGPPDGSLLMPYQGKGLVIFDPTTQDYQTQPMTGDTHQHGVGLTGDGRLLVVGVGAIGGPRAGRVSPSGIWPAARRFWCRWRRGTRTFWSGATRWTAALRPS